jgi:hypothetical protein
MIEYLNHKLLKHKNKSPGFYWCSVCGVTAFKGYDSVIDENSWFYNKTVLYVDEWIENITCEEMQIKNLLE